MSLFETRQIYKVSEVTRFIKLLLEESPIGDLWVEGEVSNFRRPSSGHLYFTLKDAESQIECVIFKSTADRLRFIPEDGISIIIHGKLTIYEQRGIYQIVGTRVEPLGLGALQLALEQLKQKLAEEGLFNEAHKKPIPLVPRRIGVITSPTGAAIRDILSIISRRFYNVSILIHPVAVQGEGAAEEIAEAIYTLNRIGGLDVLIVARGGGSLEDLWAFNEEVVARSIYASNIPVISAVGHEIDFTIADFVADCRAPTPSAAAEMVIPNKVELLRTLDNLKTRIYANMSNQMGSLQARLKDVHHRLMLRDVRNKVHSFQQDIDYLLSRAYNTVRDDIGQRRRSSDDCQKRLIYAGVSIKISEMHHRISELEQKCVANIRYLLGSRRDEFRVSVAKLNALSPLSVLQRGYGLCFFSSGELIKSVGEVSAGSEIKVRLGDGEMLCEVKQTVRMKI